MISLQKEDFSPDEILASLKTPEAGAIVSFLGVVRADTGVAEGLDVEAYEEMATEKLKTVAESARKQFEINSISIVHRYGRLLIGENIAFVAVSAPSRVAAFDAARWTIDELKKVVPLWKREI